MSTFASEGAIAVIRSSICCITLLLKTGASRVSACARRCFKFCAVLAKLDRLPQERLFFQRFLDQAEQLLRRVRFADEMICAALDRLDRVVQRIVRRQNDHLRVRDARP